MNAFPAVLSTEERVVGLCWENENLKDRKDLRVEEVGELGLPVARAALACRG